MAYPGFLHRRALTFSDIVPIEIRWVLKRRIMGARATPHNLGNGYMPLVISNKRTNGPDRIAY